MNNKEIYLVFTRTGTVLSRIIGLYTKERYNHVSLSFDDKFNNMYTFGRIYASNPIIAGFIKEDLSSGLYSRIKKGSCLIYKISISENQEKKLYDELEKFSNDPKKYKYNFIGLLGFFFEKPIGRRNHYFCSQFVSEVLIKSNILNMDKHPALIKPLELLNIEQKEFMYEGYINDLNLTIGESTFA